MIHYHIYALKTKEEITLTIERQLTQTLAGIVQDNIDLTKFWEVLPNSYFPFEDFLLAITDVAETWDNWIEDITRLAKIYPNYTFIIDGDDGDEFDKFGMWRSYFRGDKRFTANAQITFETPEWYGEG